jgi:hypothetical protein
MLCGVTIDNMITGGPAHNSRQLEAGDVILQVDGAAATLASLRSPSSFLQAQIGPENILAGKYIGPSSRKSCPWKQRNSTRSQGRLAGSLPTVVLDWEMDVWCDDCHIALRVDDSKSHI